MGRHKQQDKYSESYWENHTPECSRGLFHIIKHHPLCPFMKRLARKSDNGGGERSANTGTVPARITADTKKDLNLAETRNSNVEQKVTPFSSVAKSSVKKQIKALIKEISKKRSRHDRSSSCPVVSHSNHDLEQSNADSSSKSVQTDHNTRVRRRGQCDSKPSGEYQWVRKHQPVKKDFQGQEIKDEKQCGRKHTNKNSDISTFLHDPASPRIYHFNKQHRHSTKATLTRSASFPLPDSIGNASLQKGKGKLCIGSKSQKSVQLKSSKKKCGEAMQSSASEWRLHGDVNTFSGSSQKWKEIKHVKNLKQKIELVTGENIKEKVRVTNDAIIHKLPQGHVISEELKKEILKKLTDPSCNENHSRHSIRRTRSLPELESYSKLQPQLMKLKLRPETAHSSPLRIKILSSPDLQSFLYANQNGESYTFHQKRLDLDVHSRNKVQFDTPVEILIQENLVREGENDSVISNGMGSESDCGSKINDNLGIIVDYFGQTSLRSDGTSNDQDTGAIKEDKAAIAESDSKSIPGPVDRLDKVEEQQEANKDLLKVIETTENAQKVEILNHQIPQFQLDTRHKDEFNYVKYVLEISGLTGKDSLSAWHSSHHPVDPLLYEEMESDPEFCNGGNCNHHVLFDLINESVLEIYGRSYNCFHHPNTTTSPFSSLPLIHQMPGSHIVPKVWAKMSRSMCLRFRGGKSYTVDDHVGRDLAKLNEVVNLQWFAECVGLEVEDLIFHELLEEIVCELA